MSIRYTTARSHSLSLEGWKDIDLLNSVQSSELYNVSRMGIAGLLALVVTTFCTVRAVKWCYTRFTSSNKTESVEPPAPVREMPSPRSILISPRHMRDTKGVAKPASTHRVKQGVHKTEGTESTGAERARRAGQTTAAEEGDASHATQPGGAQFTAAEPAPLDSANSSWSDWQPLRTVNRIVRDFSFSSLKPEEKAEFSAWEARGVDVRITRGESEVKQEVSVVINRRIEGRRRLTLDSLKA
ncbi:hypothetical protein OF83DRAFT_1174949 [Amylostereum chailletii]|nr:hypothetical protein OF83DRAFT_1174949 [Amylostereum chailletii]